MRERENIVCGSSECEAVDHNKIVFISYLSFKIVLCFNHGSITGKPGHGVNEVVYFICLQY